MFQASSVVSTPAVLQLIASTYDDSQVDPSVASSYFNLMNTGAATGGPTVTLGNGSYSWLTGGSGSAYEIKYDIVSGTFTSAPTASTWLSLGTTRAWTVDRSIVGLKTTTATFTIRRVSDSVTVAGPIDITFNATITSSGGGGGGGGDPRDPPGVNPY